jgi:DNA-binding NtrC family response regulator
MSDILICNGDVSFLRNIEEMLIMENYQVETTESASELLQKLLCQNFEALILGAKIKGMDMLEVIPIVKLVDAGLPIIAVADSPSLETERRARMQNIFYYFVNPINMDEMKAVLREAIKKQAFR